MSTIHVGTLIWVKRDDELPFHRKSEIVIKDVTTFAELVVSAISYYTPEMVIFQQMTIQESGQGVANWSSLSAN